jgi:hypothetical protein
MNNYVNLQPLQMILEDCLFLVRYIITDHQETPVTAEDYSNLDLKLIELLNTAKTLLNLESSVTDYLPNLYESNHIKETRDKIFIKAINAFLKYCNNEGKSFDSSHLEAAHTIANDSIEKLYKVKL